MLTRIVTYSKIAILTGFAVSVLGAFLMGGAGGLPKVFCGLVIAAGVLLVFIGVGTYIVSSIVNLVKRPGEEAGAVMEGEYYPLMETGEMAEAPARLPARRVLSGKIDNIPLVIRLYLNPSGRSGGSMRTEFFSPFGYSRGGRTDRFRLYPTGEEVRSDLGVEERFSRSFYVPDGDYEAFRESGLSAKAMGAILDFQDENGGVLSMDERGLFWSVDRLDFGGFGSEIARQFANVSGIVRNSLGRGGGSEVGDFKSVPEELLYASTVSGVGSSQPTYATRKTLVVIVALLLSVGGLTLLGAIFTYSDNRDVFVNLIAVSIFTLTPGLIMVPILIYHIVRSKPASKPDV